MGPVADADDVRRLALSLPHVVEIPSAGFDFRVADKGFVWSYPERRPGRPRVIRTDVAVLFVGDLEEQQALLLGEPDLFFTAPGYESSPLVMLRLDQVGVERLAELVTDAWRMRAPEDLVGGSTSTSTADGHRRPVSAPYEPRLGHGPRARGHRPLPRSRPGLRTITRGG